MGGASKAKETNAERNARLSQAKATGGNALALASFQNLAKQRGSMRSPLFGGPETGFPAAGPSGNNRLGVMGG